MVRRKDRSNPRRKGGVEEIERAEEKTESQVALHRKEKASRRAESDQEGQSPSPGPRPRPEGTRPGLRRRKAPGFYAESLDSTEQAQLGEALEMEGLDEEIALLRVRLRRLLEEEPEDTEFLLKGIALLAKLTATRYRLSKTAEDDLYQSMLGVIKGIGGAIWPEAFEGS